MVYLGKPSKGCQVCRTRRIKCDEATPSCGQCVKSRRQCPGYKSDFDLIHRNETQATARRARRGTKLPPIQTREPKSTIEFRHSTPQTFERRPKQRTDSPSENIPVSPTQSVAERAQCHFVANFVLNPPQGTERGYLEFVLPILNDNPPKAFTSALEACCLASLGNRVGTGRDFERQALGKYTESLAAIATAIHDPVLSKSDGILAAVLLLGLFENITSRNVGMLAWGSHTDGAIQLIKGRGPQQFQTKQGRDLWVAVRTQTIIQSFTTGRPPALGAAYWIKGAAKDKFGTIGQHIVLRNAELRPRVNECLSSLRRQSDQRTVLRDLIKECQRLDEDIDYWTKNLPEYFQFKTVTWQNETPVNDLKKAEAYPGRVDAYRDIWVTSVWNTVRCTHIVLASMIIRCAALLYYPVDYRTTLEYAKYSRLSQEVISDIIASIPYQLGWFATRKHLLDEADLTSYACGQDSSQKMLAGHFMSWPLSCIMTQDFAMDDQRKWAQGRLEFVASELGLRYVNMIKHSTLRIPSMLIRRDIATFTGEKKDPGPVSAVLSTRTVPPSGI